MPFSRPLGSAAARTVVAGARWGHRSPVWYGPDGWTVCAGPEEQPLSGAGWTQDLDVLDTWLSSGLWPFSTLGWPDETAAMARFHPTDVLLTGHDIIFFRVARMMMSGLYAMDRRPLLRTVALPGLVRALRLRLPGRRQPTTAPQPSACRCCRGTRLAR